MTWFGKSLVVFNTVVSLFLLGAIVWMVLESRQFREDLRQREERLKVQEKTWSDTRGTLAGLLQEQAKGDRLIVWEVDRQGQPVDKIPVAKAREHLNKLGKFLADGWQQLEKLQLQLADLRDKLYEAVQETYRLSKELADVSEKAREIQPVPGKPSPEDEMRQRQREVEAQLRDLEFPSHQARQAVAVLMFRLGQLKERKEELEILRHVPPFKPHPAANPTSSAR